MKHVFFFLFTAGFSFFLLTSCSDTERKPGTAAEVTSPAPGAEASQDGSSADMPGGWVQKGTECYGIVIITFQDGRTIGKSVRCKVLSVSSDKLKMKALENVSLMESVGCDKLGLSYGDTWWETEGDIFRTREEADDYLLKKGWLNK